MAATTPRSFWRGGGFYLVRTVGKRYWLRQMKRVTAKVILPVVQIRYGRLGLAFPRELALKLLQKPGNTLREKIHADNKNNTEPEQPALVFKKCG